ncbi:MAG: hypothetical protein GX493_03235 [Firmicutes bacterium]|nr:hypothetical protein [Bacillota bacterium]
MGTRTVLPLGARGLGEAALVGPRMAGLNLLRRLGFPVAPGFGVFPPDRKREVLRGPSPDLHRAVTAAYRRLGGLVAVWTADDEKPSLFGLAGQEAVWRGVLRSLTTGGGPVFVQRLPDAIASGVAYSVDPENGRPEMVVEATRGLGGLVGAEEKDRFRLAKRPLLLLASSTANKTRETRAGPMGLVGRPLPPSLRRAPCLGESELLTFGRLLRRVEERVGAPIRLSWALTTRGFCFFSFAPLPPPIRDPFYLVPEVPPAFTDRRYLANWEIPAEVVTPLTGDFITRVTRAAWAKVTDALRLPTLAAVPPLVLVEGRIRDNFLAVSREIEQSLGLPAGCLAPSAPRARLARLYGLSRLTLHLLPSFHRLWRFCRFLALNIQREAEEMRAAAGRFRTSCREQIPPAALAELLKEAVTLWDRHILTLAAGPFLAAYRFRRFRRLLLRYGGREAVHVIGPLVAGLGPPEEVEWAYGLWTLTRRLGTAFLPDGDPEETWAKFANGGAGRDEAAVALESLTATYVHLGPGWMELANPRWVENPRTVRTAILNWRDLEAGGKRPEEHRRQLAAARSQAVAWVDGRLTTGWRKLFFWRSPRLARARQRMTEAIHLLAEVHGSTARFVAAFRRLALLAGEELVHCGYLERPEEIFFLRPDEIQTCLLGTAEVDRIACLRAERAAAWSRYRSKAEEPPPPVEEGKKRPPTLPGVAAYPGRAAGRACLVRSPEDFSSFPCGAILVAANVDYGWAPLFLRAGGVATEEGGEMSPPAVLAREFGLPAVVGVKGLSAWITEGELIEVDGTGGRITAVR